MPFHKTSTVDRRLTIVHKGFTLIELLIVITIIGILASLTLASYSNAQQKARDAVRKSDLGQLKRAMELAKSDCNGAAYYPTSVITTPVPDFITLNAYITNTNLKYMTSTLTDPQNVAPQQYAYAPDAVITNKCPATDGTGSLTYSGSNDYAVWVKLERTSDSDSITTRNKCSGKPGYTTWNNSGYYVVCD